MHPALLLAIYCLVCAVASLAGGWVPLVVKLTHRRMQIAISFVSGMMLGIGLLHLLPHSIEALGSVDQAVGWLMAGYLFMFFLERFFHFHHHEIDEQGAPAAVEHHDHAGHDHPNHGHAHHAAETLSAGGFSWSAAAVGLTLHGFVDGAALAAAVEAESLAGAATLAGFGAFLAIALHKPFDSLTIGTLMAAAGRTPAMRRLFNALYALVTPLGVLLFYFAFRGMTDPHDGLGQVLAFAAGAFVCIASSDLLPELQFHRHDRVALSVALLAGLALAWAMIFIEGAGHDHSHGHESHHHGAETHHHDDHHADHP